ncbi:MAG: thymidine kinase [Cytophagales bacterium]|nr:thymidine kinase [Cytophagales bacterium]
MVNELSTPYNTSGHIEVICGCMFSGKTEELIRRIKRAQIAHLQTFVCKPITDNRYHEQYVISHDMTELNAVSLASPQEILTLAKHYKVIGIDEAQFFDHTIVEVCNVLANEGKRVIVAGLDMDFEGKPFGAMPYLLAVAEYVTKLQAVCTISGESASFTYRKSHYNDTLLVGGQELYEARSRQYFYNSDK